MVACKVEKSTSDMEPLLLGYRNAMYIHAILALNLAAPLEDRQGLGGVFAQRGHMDSRRNRKPHRGNSRNTRLGNRQRFATGLKELCVRVRVEPGAERRA
jgi:hypothetical protein